MIKLPDPEFFNFKDCVIAGDECVLVTPKMMGIEWTEENKYFRSSIWSKSNMHPVSLGFRKFMNYGEKPEFEPLPVNDHLEVITKVDGSCLIVSKYKGELIVRTRGTIDATQLENGYEIELLKKKYPIAFNNTFLESEQYTLLFEWTTPSNRIVLQETKEPTLWLIGMVCHKDYSYVSQRVLDNLAKELEVRRPRTYIKFAGEDIELLKNAFEHLNNIEGIVVYTGNGQILKKIKTLRYLELHRVFTGIKSVDHLFDVFVEYGIPKRDKFEEELAKNFDWELVATLKDLLDQLYTKWIQILTRVNWIQLYFNNPDFIELDRKGKAQKILELFPDCSGIAFAMLDNKEITPEKLWKVFTENS